jgi:hypothetical protein
VAFISAIAIVLCGKQVRWSAEHLRSNMPLFADFADDSTLSSTGSRLYKPVRSFAKLQRILEDTHMTLNVGNYKVICYPK